MSVRPIKQISTTTPALEGAGVKLQRAFFGNTASSIRFSCSMTFATKARRLSRRLPWHPSRHQDHMLAGQVARRQPRQSRQPRRRRRAVDDRWQRNPASGDAAGRRARAHARVPTVSESAGGAEDDPAALSGRRRARHSRSCRRRWHARAGHRRRLLGRPGRGRRSGSATSTCRCPGRRKHPVERSRHVFVRLRRAGSFATPRAAGSAERADRFTRSRNRQSIARAVRSRRRNHRAGRRRGSGSCSSRANRSKSRSRGAGRS